MDATQSVKSYKLNPLPTFTKRPGPVVLLILDGVGMGKEVPSNAVYVAKTPTLDDIFKGPLYTQLKAHGTAVGMPSDADMGNSEVGHNALGAGRVFDQGASLVNQAIDSKSVFQSPHWGTIIKRHQNAPQTHTLHLIGLLSDGNVHAHMQHWIALIEAAAAAGVNRIRCHICLDGRDVAARSALTYIDQLETIFQKVNEVHAGDYQIASGGGRMVITMDRYDADWPMVERGWAVHVNGEGPQFNTATDAVQKAYDVDGVNDQYIPPFVIAENGEAVGKVTDGDSMICMNFRGDRTIEWSKAMTLDTVDQFDRGQRPDVYYVGMMEYDGDTHIPEHYLVNPPQIEGSVSDYLCGMGVKALAISETQKYGHVTFFWNGNKSNYINKALETYIEIPSDPRPFEQQPEMRAREITAETIKVIEQGDVDFVRVNYPNGDMIGHTGIMSAAVAAMEVVDGCVKQVIEAVTQQEGVVVVLADHGNADEMTMVRDGQEIPKTSHTLNPVPFVIIDPLYKGEYELARVDTPGLANVAATLCHLLGFEPPDEFADSLITLKQ